MHLQRPSRPSLGPSGHFAAALSPQPSARAAGVAYCPARTGGRRKGSLLLREHQTRAHHPGRDPVSSSSDSESDDSEPGRRVAMAMAASWGGSRGLGAASKNNDKAPSASAPRSRLRAIAAKTTATAPPSIATTTTTATADLSRAIAASARAAALSSQLRAAHDALPNTPTGSGSGSALISPLTALADAAAAADTLTAGARTGTCEFFAYVLPASPFLPAWREAVRAALPSLSRAQLADAFFALGRLPYYAPAPLPIGFGTPRYSRPLAASEPEEWENLLNEAAEAWLRLPPPPSGSDKEEEARFLLGLALSRRWAGERVGDAWLASREAGEALSCALAELKPSSSSSPSGGGLSPAARLAAALLQVRGAPPTPLARALFEETAAPAPEGKGWPESWRADRRPPSSLGAMISFAAEEAGEVAAAASAAAVAAEAAAAGEGDEDAAASASTSPSSSLSSRLERWRARVRWQDGEQCPDGVGGSLPPPPPSPAAGANSAAAAADADADSDAAAGEAEEERNEEGDDDSAPATAPQQPTLASTLMQAHPPAPPPCPPSALCSELSPKQVQRLARGLVYLGLVPPDPWLAALASAARCALGGGAALSRSELGALRDALKFFLSERRGEDYSPRGGGPWRRSASGGRGEDRTGLGDAVSLLDEWRVSGSGAF